MNDSSEDDDEEGRPATQATKSCPLLPAMTTVGTLPPAGTQDPFLFWVQTARRKNKQTKNKNKVPAGD